MPSTDHVPSSDAPESVALRTTAPTGDGIFALNSPVVALNRTSSSEIVSPCVVVAALYEPSALRVTDIVKGTLSCGMPIAAIPLELPDHSPTMPAPLSFFSSSFFSPLASFLSSFFSHVSSSLLGRYGDFTSLRSGAAMRTCVLTYTKGDSSPLNMSSYTGLKSRFEVKYRKSPSRSKAGERSL